MSEDAKFAEFKQRIDVAQVFLCYMATIGDVEKTALALELDPAFVTWLANQEGWSDKVRRLTVMSKSGKPGDFERAQNRALNYIQAHRVRTLIDRVLVELVKEDPDRLAERFKSIDRSGKPNGISARFFADITAALDKVHQLSYYALGDSVGERLDRAKDGDGASVNDIHVALIQALNNPAVSESSTEALVLEASEAISAASSERKKTDDVKSDETSCHSEKSVDS